MKNYSIYLGMIFALSCTSLSAEGMNPVENFELQSYLGDWHEIASIPASFQKHCHFGTKAVYTERDDRKLQVINSCHKKDSTLKIAEGIARKDKRFELPSQLQVTFVRIANKPIWIFGGKYWVLALGENYEYSLVGEPGRNYAWILARDPELPVETLESLKASLTEQGYDPCALLMSRQTSSDFELRRPNLCEFLETN